MREAADAVGGDHAMARNDDRQLVVAARLADRPRFPIEFLVLACLVVGIIPSLSIGPFLHSAVVSVLGTRTPEYSLAIWHGINTPLIMSMIALVGGVALYAVLKDYLARCDDGPPLFRHLGGQRIQALPLRGV